MQDSTAQQTSAGATVIDGKAEAARLRARVKADAEAFAKKTGVTPGLAVIIVGDNPASATYVRNKNKAASEAGLRSFVYTLDASAPESALLEKVRELNEDPTVHGILVQLPLPEHMNEERVIDTISPDKDVDGFHVHNAGRLFIGAPELAPCTPKGCMTLIRSALPGSLAGKHAVIVGRSNIVGKPMAALLLAADCTVTIVHSRTPDPAALSRQADIVVAAAGKPGLVTRDWVKPGAVVIDVGINRVEGEGGKSVLTGDVAYEDVLPVAGAITPVPGGVGPMTVACLLDNTYQAARAQTGADE